MRARVYVTPKQGVLDPQGEAVAKALRGLGFSGAMGVRQGKYFEIELENDNRTKAESKLREMCEKLLANTVIEQYRFEIL